MTNPTSHQRTRNRALDALSIAAALFGLATIASGGRTLFGGAAESAVAVVGFVLWFNFGAGFAGGCG